MSVNTLTALLNLMQEAEDNLSMSLPQYTRGVMISSQTYIDQTIVAEPILPVIIEQTYDLYASFVLAALSMNNYISDTQRVRDVLKQVSTERLDNSVAGTISPRYKPVLKATKEYFGSLEAFSNYDNTDDDSKQTSIGDMGFMEPKNEAKLLQGRLLKVTLGVGNRQTVAEILIKLNPTYIPPEVIKEAIVINNPLDFSKRWLQARAGEISTFKDLLLGLDLRRRRLNALKKDKNGLLRDMMNRQDNATFTALLKLTQITPNRQNIANTIFVYSKETFDAAANAANLKVDNYDSRQKFMSKAFAMMLIIVDTRYNTVKVYYHGLDQVSTFTFEQLNKAEKYNAGDLLSIMKNYSAGMAPKF